MIEQKDLILKIQEMQLEISNLQKCLDLIDSSKKPEDLDKKINSKVKSFCTEIVKGSINDLSKELTISQSKLMSEKLNSKIEKILADKVESIISEKVNLNFINKLYRGR